MSSVTSVVIDKPKHVLLEITVPGSSSPLSLHFAASSKDVAEAIVSKLESSRELISGNAQAAQRQSVDRQATPPRTVTPRDSPTPEPKVEPTPRASILKKPAESRQESQDGIAAPTPSPAPRTSSGRPSTERTRMSAYSLLSNYAEVEPVST